MGRLKHFVIPLVIGILMVAGRASAQEEEKIDVMPVPRTKAQVVYPKEALSKGIEGTVWVKAFVDVNGQVQKAEILKSEAEILNGAALEAAKKWSFAPATKDGKPVAVWITLPFKFKLADDGAKKKG